MWCLPLYHSFAAGSALLCPTYLFMAGLIAYLLVQRNLPRSRRKVFFQSRCPIPVAERTKWKQPLQLSMITHKRVQIKHILLVYVVKNGTSWICSSWRDEIMRVHDLSFCQCWRINGLYSDYDNDAIKSYDNTRWQWRRRGRRWPRMRNRNNDALIFLLLFPHGE